MLRPIDRLMVMKTMKSYEVRCEEGQMSILKKGMTHEAYRRDMPI